MADCIEREAALAVFHDWIDKHGDVHTVDEIPEYEEIENLPAADVRSVVLCRDCKFTKTDGMEDPAIYCEKWDRWEMPPDGFCWLGKKRKETTNGN